MPLKHLVKDKIETHLLAFEIYFRKGDFTSYFNHLIFGLLFVFFPLLKHMYAYRFAIRQVPADAPIYKESVHHRPRPPVATPVSSPLLQRRYSITIEL